MNRSKIWQILLTMDKFREVYSSIVRKKTKSKFLKRDFYRELEKFGKSKEEAEV
ncbi:MAG: hypothetical protein GY820_18310 [Gammaproteobacteria bacterium]|nr:hypothetical protein [Gammaproteobacteria bacterium]